ncbi:MAG: phytoene/squalene synthase family protein [Gemmatimonadaceae bacterium]
MTNESLPKTDEGFCAELVRHHARTFAAASRFLPAEKRRAAFAVYAFCRVADDFVDEAIQGATGAEQDLNQHSRALSAVYEGTAQTPLFRELRWAVDKYGIPSAPFHGLMHMLRTDLAPVQYETWTDLERYCGGVASTVGEMCAHVFGMPASAVIREDALRCARILGVALQLTNILRDVGEDAARGRCYLPLEDLSRFGISRDEILGRTIRGSDIRWQALMRFEVARTRALYAEAEPGIRYLDRDSQCCATICASGYAGILGAIERRNYDTLSGRAHIGTARKLLVMFNAWRVTRSSAPALPASHSAAPGEQPMRA